MEGLRKNAVNIVPQNFQIQSSSAISTHISQDVTVSQTQIHQYVIGMGQDVLYNTIFLAPAHFQVVEERNEMLTR